MAAHPKAFEQKHIKRLQTQITAHQNIANTNHRLQTQMAAHSKAFASTNRNTFKRQAFEQ